MFVTVAIAAALTVQLMVVLSSGLFEAITVTVVYDDGSVTATELFTGDYNNTMTARPASIYYGRLLYNLSYPLGTTQDYAYQLFNSSHSSVEDVSATVDVFSADLDCSSVTPLKVTNSFYTGSKDNPLLDSNGFTVSTDDAARDVWLAAVDEPSCSDLVVRIKNEQLWNYNGSYCPDQPEGPDRNRLVFVSGSWNAGAMSTIRVSGVPTSTAGLIPASLLAGDSTTATQTVSAIATQTVSAAGLSSTGSTSAPGLSTKSRSHDVFIQVETKTSSSSSATSSSGNDIQLDDPPSDFTIGVNAKRADSTKTTRTSTLADPSVFLLPTSTYTPEYAIVCKPRYTIRKANVTLSKTASSADINTNLASGSSGFAFANMTLLEGERKLDNFSAWTMMSPVFMSIELANYQLNNNGLLGFINAAAPEAKSGEDEIDRIIDGLRQTYRSISAQVASTYLTQAFAQNSSEGDLNSTLTGRTVVQETRLAMQAPAFWITEAALLVAIFGTSFLLLNSSDMRMSRDPGTIGGLATILARSEGTMRIFAGTGAMPLSKVKEVVGPDKEFAAGTVQASNGSSTWCEFLIETNDEGSLQDGANQRPEDSDGPPEWYRPFAVSLLGRVLIISVPLALIVALEVLYQYSAGHDGLADVDQDNRYAHYAWTFIPTLVMVGVGQLFGMLDFATKLFAPYSALRKEGGVPARTSIMDSYLDKLGVHALFAALGRKQWAVAAVAVATVLSPFLTIVTSGLLNAETAPLNYTVAITQLNTFETAGQQYSSGTIEANLVLASNLTYPQWTYDTLAIPQLKIASTQSSHSLESTASNATSLRATVPAVRGVANCTVQNPSSFQNCSSTWLETYMVLTGNKFVPQVNSKFDNDGYFGRWQLPPYDEATPPPGCPSVITVFGRVENDTIVQATHLACYPYVEKVDATVTLILPDYRVDIDQRPPEAPAIGHGELFSDDIWSFNSDGDIGGLQLANPNLLNATYEDFGSLYGLVVWGPDGVPSEELVQDGEKLVSRVEKVFAQVMAQLLNKERVWLGNGTAEASRKKRDTNELTGTILYTARTRLKQSPISTRILEALLAIMFICAALSAALLDTNRVLPKNPCSIAAVATLLAGSELLASIPRGAEWMSDKQLKERGVFEGKVYSMGWWGGSVGDSDGSISSSGGRRFGIDIGTAVSEKGGGSDAGDGNATKPRWRPAWLRGRAK
ncbi:hypothetical protein DIS24_g1526 [Lasiodiplodia hormozganensis]|uniref:Uncharacterized protein n=1 Tax=Lasiodiplodia hormozganensis TaxID=869390 RepID=A0AA39Z3W7_9PEZI|nr:hypothetical protein DIS24_g1526 [Lasiodiplodia hormozganensis]